MPMDAKTQAVMTAMQDGFPALTPGRGGAEVRELVRSRSAAARRESIAVDAVLQRTIPGPDGELTVRIYRPLGAAPGPLPAVVFFHGGGWVLCDLDSHDGLCRALANEAGCVVVAVDYRLAPEHPFPAAPDDCFAALRWLAAHGGEVGVDTTRLAVAGDSAGGNLAAVVALRARDEGGPALRAQVLLYPLTDFSDTTASHREIGADYFLSSADAMWYWRHYLADEADGAHQYASPLRAGDLSGLPPALIITAEFDPLRDEGEAYGARMAAAGVSVSVHRYDGMFHGFVSLLSVLEPADEALVEVAVALRAALELVIADTVHARAARQRHLS
jgi:acetyl esterase